MRLKQTLRGTHRERTPEDTLALLEPYVLRAGVSRCADIAGLDELGIPVFAAIRPAAGLVQVASGKGVSAVAARVSALMEAIEHAAAERPPKASRFDSLRGLRRSGAHVLHPRVLPGFAHDRHFTDDRKISWVEAQHLGNGKATWVPASAAHALEPSLYEWTSNGLASGNSIVEATVHAIYEVVERHTLSLLVDGGSIDFAGCCALELDSIDDDVVRALVVRVRRRVELRLLRLDIDWPLHTFIAVLLDPRPFARSSTVSLGYGAHLSPAIAAARAITEAAQSRLTFIHGAREDLPGEAYRGEHRRVYDLFASIGAESSWSSLADGSTDDLERDLATVLACLETAGFHDLYRVVLEADDNIAVVKVLVPGALNHFPF